jgi:hypothetical protein
MSFVLALQAELMRNLDLEIHPNQKKAPAALTKRCLVPQEHPNTTRKNTQSDKNDAIRVNRKGTCSKQTAKTT